MNAVIEAMESRKMLSTTPAADTQVYQPDFVPVHPVRSGGAQPAGYTSPSGVGGLSPTQVRGAYGLGAVGSSTLNFNGVVGDGTGQTIALVDAFNDPNIATDLATFDTAEGLPAPPSFSVVEQTVSGQSPANSATSGANDWSGEESLDVEWAHVIAPGASIVLVEAYSSSGSYLEQADQVAAAISGVSVVSNSYGGGESSNESTSLDPYFTTPSGHTGVSFFASTGDSAGSVEYPAQSPNVVAVGGTQLTVSGSTWSSETVWDYPAGGEGTGGGTSSYESQPSFQAGTVTASKRETPDISMAAGQNSNSSNCYVAIADSWDSSASAPWQGVVGTSWSSPMTAGMVAIANQGRVLEGLGNLKTVTGSNAVDTRLYELPASNFHDITTGTNGHAAAVGYDEASGIGTPIAGKLIPDLAGAGTVTGTVYIDNNGDGVYDTGDTPLSGVSVYLDLNNDGSKDNSEPVVTTNAQGVYTFTDQPAGGSIRLTTPTISGLTLSSASSASIVYGATDTANFIYKTNSTQLAFAQQPPTSTPLGGTISPIIVDVENSTGQVNTGDGSTVTLTLSQGTFSSTGTNTATAGAVNGVATFSNLVINSAGTYTVTATDGTLTSAVSNSFIISQGTPVVTWANPSLITYGTPLSSTQLDATANVPGTFVYTPAAGTILGAGSGQTLSVVFTPTDTTDYTTATGSATITVQKATPVITWTNPASITYGTALGSTQLDATTPVDGSFLYTPAAGTVLSAGAGQNLSVTFTPSDSYDYKSVNKSVTITVTQATPVVSWPPPGSITYGTTLSSTQLDATSNTPGTFVYTPAAGTLLSAGAGQNLSVSFTPTDSTDYTTATGSTTITVLQATPTITWSAPAPITYGTPLSATQLDATANVAGSFVYSPAAGTVLSPGANQALDTTFTPTDTTDYTTATGSTTITVTGVQKQPINLTGSTFYLKLDNASPANLDIWLNSTAAGTPALVTEFDHVSSITLSANAAGDSFTTDFSDGTVVPSGGLTLNGFGPAAGNSLIVVGTQGADTVTVPGGGTFNLNAQTVDYSAGTIGGVYFKSPGLGEALTVPSGTVTIAPGTGTGITDETFSSITIGSGAELALPAAANHSQRILLQTGALNIAGSGSGGWTSTLDLSNNDLDVANGNLATISSQLLLGTTAGTGGILSSTAASDPAALTTLGAVQNSVDGKPTSSRLYGSGAPLGLFDGTNPANTDVLVKYTYYGDANVDGATDGSDYSLIDNGFNSQKTSTPLSGWYNGDFNYDGKIDGSDYTLIDNAFNTQGASLASQIASSSRASSGAGSAVQSAGVFSTVPISQSDSLKDKSAAGLTSLASQLFSTDPHDLT